MTFRRAGRYVEITSRWPPGEHDKFKKRARDERPKIKSRVDEAIARLCDLLKKYDPIPLVLALYIENGVLDAETYSEPTFEGSEAHVEYLQSLALAADSMGTATGDEEVLSTVRGLVKEIFEGVEWYFHLEAAEEKRKEWEYRLRYTSILRFLKLRGSSIEEHHRDLIRELFSEHDDFLLRTVGLTTAQILAAADEIERQFLAALNAQMESMLKARMLHARFQEFVTSRPDLDAKSLDDVLREFDAQVDPADRQAVKQMFLIDPARVEPNALIPTSILDRLSSQAADNQSFLDDKSRGWPTGDSIVYRRPLIRRGTEYFCPNPVLLFRKLDRIIESWIATDESYYQTTFAKKRGKFVERTALKHLGTLLPGAGIHSNLYYNAVDEVATKRVETDAVICWDRALLVVEAKAAGLDIPARRGALAGLRDDIGDIVVDAFRQGERTRRYIEASPTVNFDNEHGDVVLTVSRNDYDYIFVVNVTLESLGFLTAGIHVLKEMGLVAGDAWPWSVFVNDLRVISEILETGSDFIAFLRCRLKAPEFPQFSVGDELDFLMAYLYEGVNLTEVNLERFGLFNLNGYTVDLDRYYAFLAGSVSTGPKPQTKTPAPFQELIRLIEKQARPGFLRVTLALLEMDRMTMLGIARDLSASLTDAAEGSRRHQVQLRSPDGKSLITIFVASGWSEGQVHAKLAESDLRKYDAHADRVLSIFVEPGPNGLKLHDYFDRMKPWQRDEKLEVEIAGRKRDALHEFLRQNPIPPPNAKCPCGSTRKFKRCCRALV